MDPVYQSRGTCCISLVVECGEFEQISNLLGLSRAAVQMEMVSRRSPGFKSVTSTTLAHREPYKVTLGSVIENLHIKIGRPIASVSRAARISHPQFVPRQLRR